MDADERFNRVRIGVTDDGSRDGIISAVIEAGVPAEAIRVVKVLPTVAASSITDRIRPVGAGLQIQNDAFGSFTETCTAGFAVEHDGDWGFLTAGHCSLYGSGGGTTGEDFYQKVKTSNDLIGQVSENPVWNVSNCQDDSGNPTSATCTNADAIWVTTTNLSSIRQEIAGVSSVHINDDLRGGKTINSWLEVDANSVGGAMSGTTAFKIGRTTGYTGGEIDATCVYKEVDTYVVKCAGIVSGSAIGRGDSGGPVFGIEQFGGDPVPYGIVTGVQGINHQDPDGDYCESPPGPDKCIMVYSSVEGIQTHFGHAFDYNGGPPISIDQMAGPFAVQPSAYCTWQAYVDGGTEPFSFAWSGVLSGNTTLPYIAGSPSGSGYLNVTVTDANGRQDSDSFYIFVDGSADPCFE